MSRVTRQLSPGRQMRRETAEKRRAWSIYDDKATSRLADRFYSALTSRESELDSARNSPSVATTPSPRAGIRCHKPRSVAARRRAPLVAARAYHAVPRSRVAVPPLAEYQSGNRAKQRQSLGLRKKGRWSGLCPRWRPPIRASLHEGRRPRAVPADADPSSRASAVSNRPPQRCSSPGSPPTGAMSSSNTSDAKWLPSSLFLRARYIERVPSFREHETGCHSDPVWC
jgi:hypothetical protein